MPRPETSRMKTRFFSPVMGCKSICVCGCDCSNHPSLQYIVVWSDIYPSVALFGDLVYFYESDSKNRRIWPCVRQARNQQIFHFQKVTGTLKLFLFLNLQIPSFYFKEHSPKGKF